MVLTALSLCTRLFQAPRSPSSPSISWLPHLPLSSPGSSTTFSWKTLWTIPWNYLPFLPPPFTRAPRLPSVTASFSLDSIACPLSWHPHQTVSLWLLAKTLLCLVCRLPWLRSAYEDKSSRDMCCLKNWINECVSFSFHLLSLEILFVPLKGLLFYTFRIPTMNS